MNISRTYFAVGLAVLTTLGLTGWGTAAATAKRADDTSKNDTTNVTAAAHASRKRRPASGSSPH